VSAARIVADTFTVHPAEHPDEQTLRRETLRFAGCEPGPGICLPTNAPTWGAPGATVCRARRMHRWKPPARRRDPVELTLASNHGRLAHLIPVRHARMSASPFAFYRGSAALMAADLATTATSGIRVQACGDAHLMNFGGFATPERNVIFDINDLDETLPAPFEWDLKRLAASVVIAAEHLRLKHSDAARVAIDVVREYRERMITDVILGWSAGTFCCAGIFGPTAGCYRQGARRSFRVLKSERG
jgi:hypothetical protein